MDTLTYQERCELAATAQGLDEIVEALNEAGVWVDVAQTGGFCMAGVVPCVNGVVAVIREGAEYVVAAYPGTSWEDGASEDVFPVEIDSLDAMVTRVVADVAGLGGEREEGAAL